MKNMYPAFFSFLVLTAGCLVSLFVLTIDPPRQQAAEVQMTGIRGTAGSWRKAAEREEMAHLVLNQEAVEPEPVKDSFCLVAEEGYLIVYDDSLATVNLFTHMPLCGFSAGGTGKAHGGDLVFPPWRKFSAIWNLTPVKTCNLNAGWIY